MLLVLPTLLAKGEVTAGVYMTGFGCLTTTAEQVSYDQKD